MCYKESCTPLQCHVHVLYRVASTITCTALSGKIHYMYCTEWCITLHALHRMKFCGILVRGLIILTGLWSSFASGGFLEFHARTMWLAPLGTLCLLQRQYYCFYSLVSSEAAKRWTLALQETGPLAKEKADRRQGRHIEIILLENSTGHSMACKI